MDLADNSRNSLYSLNRSRSGSGLQKKHDHLSRFKISSSRSCPKLRLMHWLQNTLSHVSHRTISPPWPHHRHSLSEPSMSWCITPQRPHHRFQQREIKESSRFLWMCKFSEEWASTLVKGLLKRNFLHNLQIPTSSCGWLQLSNMVTSLPQPVHMKDGAASLTLILSSLCIIVTLTSHPSPFDCCFSLTLILSSLCIIGTLTSHPSPFDCCFSLTRSICMQIFQNLSLKTTENHFAFLIKKSCALKAMESFHHYLPLKSVDISCTIASLHCYEMLTFNLVLGELLQAQCKWLLTKESESMLLSSSISWSALNCSFPLWGGWGTSIRSNWSSSESLSPPCVRPSDAPSTSWYWSPCMSKLLQDSSLVSLNSRHVFAPFHHRDWNAVTGRLGLCDTWRPHSYAIHSLATFDHRIWIFYGRRMCMTV